MELSPTVTHRTSSPDDACASVAPTACSPAITSANDVANPVTEATIPADMDWMMVIVFLDADCFRPA